MATCEQPKALLAQAILARYPALGEGLDALPVDDGCMKVITRWLDQQEVMDQYATLSFFEHQPWNAEPALCLALSMSDCRKLSLKGAVERAEAAVPGLGWTMLTLLDEMGWTMSLFTPFHVGGLAEYALWCGASSDEEYRKYLEEMEDGPLTDEQFAEHFRPSDYDAGFSDLRAIKQDARPRLRRPELLRVSDEHTDPWVRELAGHLLCLARMDERLYLEVRREGSGWQPTEPMAILFWDIENDQMEHPIDEWIQQQWNAGESEPFEFYLPVDTPENTAMTIEHFEAGFARLRLFEKLADLIERKP